MLDDLVAVAQWKWRGSRTAMLARANVPAEVEEISAVAFAAKSERLRMAALVSLQGVHWPVASVILHFAYGDRYPILDKRAMKAVGGSTHYTHALWMDYTLLCRRVAQEMGIDMRTLDKALWVAGA